MAAEKQIHSAIVKALRLMLPPDAFITSIPGGDGKPTMTVGYVKGAPDLLIVYRGNAAFIEVKGPRGAMSVEQHSVADRLAKAGAPYTTARSVEQAVEFCTQIGIPLRGSVRALGAAALKPRQTRSAASEAKRA